MGRLLAASPDLAMATIPSSGEQVPAVGIGTVDYRGDPDSSSMAAFRETLSTFIRLGGTVLDTSPNYGNSEEVLGRLLEDLGAGEKMFMATKVDQEDKAAGITRMEGSQGRLGGRIDLMQVHNLIGTDVQMETLKAWRSEGRIRYIGVTTHRDEQHDALEQAMRRHNPDFIQVNYAVNDRDAADRILPLAQDLGIAVLVNRPFGKGGLFRKVRGEQLPQWAEAMDASSWAQVFLKYILAHPAQTIPIPGTTKARHAEDNLGALRGRLPDEQLRREIERYVASL
jgi:aryl-alcohol dehydrogenase-like predicted oxidoreductase